MTKLSDIADFFSLFFFSHHHPSVWLDIKYKKKMFKNNFLIQLINCLSICASLQRNNNKQKKTSHSDIHCKQCNEIFPFSNLFAHVSRYVLLCIVSSSSWLKVHIMQQNSSEIKNKTKKSLDAFFAPHNSLFFFIILFSQ